MRRWLKVKRSHSTVKRPLFLRSPWSGDTTLNQFTRTTTSSFTSLVTLVHLYSGSQKTQDDELSYIIFLFLFWLCCERKQLQTSPAATRFKRLSIESSRNESIRINCLASVKLNLNYLGELECTSWKVSVHLEVRLS